MTVLNLDCRHGLAMLPDNSVDAILTDPPYELGFMGHAWDRSGIAYDVASAEPRGDAGSAARFYQQCQWTQDDLEAALFYYCAKASKRDKDEGLDHVTPKRVLASVHGALGDSKNPNHPRRNPHPTVKPTLT